MMGFLDKLRGMTTKAVDQHGDKISKGVSKAGDVIDKKTGGKYTDKIKQGKKKVDDGLDALDRKNDDIK
jgi:MT0933-like antitoxin protein